MRKSTMMPIIKPMVAPKSIRPMRRILHARVNAILIRLKRSLCAKYRGNRRRTEVFSTGATASYLPNYCIDDLLLRVLNLFALFDVPIAVRA